MNKRLDPTDTDVKRISDVVVGGVISSVGGVEENLQRFEGGRFSGGGTLLAESAQRLAQDRHCPTGIEDLFRCQKLRRLASIALLGLFGIQVNKFLVSSSSEAPDTAEFVRDVILERGEEKRPEFTFDPIDTGKCMVPEEVQKKTLRQILSVFRRMAAAPSENVERIPIKLAQLGQSGLCALCLTLRCSHDDRPTRRVKACRALDARTMVAFHAEVPSQ